ncbi:hypothetical protein AVEN_68892-1 [Araneus ventricosus]|uniref:Peptidase A2 domain-containing protein n=1 Tax=Araneus ventricosus TaxID=182803 RepID=A0A4Y2C8I7_ARAVE|nr:hypothetical protein AVEN_68892-1 [Araneus ventricosus]
MHVRLFIYDKLSGIIFFVDSGEAVSWFLKRLASTSENGSQIRTLGLKQLELDFGLRSRFSFRFIIAENSHPIIGEDFLECFGLIVDVKNRRLIHNLTTLVSDGISCPGPTLD